MNWLFKILYPDRYLELEQAKIDFERERLEKANEAKPCEACDAYRLQIAHLIEENKKLLDKIITPVVQEPRLVTEEPPKQIHRGVLPWRVKQQMLERQTRLRAEQKSADKAAMSEAANVASDVKVDKLEKEMGIAQEG